MRSKNILSTVAFVAAFGLSAAFASLFITKPTYTYTTTYTSNYQPKNHCRFRQTSPTADAITALIVADQANGQARGNAMYDIGESYPPSFNSVAFPDYAGAVEQYSDASSNMATDKLPLDFKAAWREHMKAWRDYSDFLNKSMVLSGKNSLTKNEFDELDEMYGVEIARTWQKVLDIGEDYGADVR